jgi:hypothetical protein
MDTMMYEPDNNTELRMFVQTHTLI